ncbi:MAG: Dps family protein [Candidatus Kapaibacteriota bacterium]
MKKSNEMTNKIGIDNTGAKILIEKLNKLLSNYQVFYQNTRGFHWNIRGEKFFELHLKFEELYTDLQLKIDEIAERVLTLDGTPLHTFEKYLQFSEIKPVENISDGRTCIASILDSFKIIITLQRELLDLSAKYNDEGTNALMSDYIRAQEKLVWMYSAYLKN